MPDFYATSTNNAVEIEKDIYITPKDNNFAKLVNRSITEVTEDMLEGVTSIGNSSFYYCIMLTNVAIPNSVISISSYAFQNCASLTNVAIPNSMASVGPYAFQNCTSLTNITCLAITPPTIQSNTFQDVPATCIIKVPAQSVEAYKSATNWSERASYIQAI